MTRRQLFSFSYREHEIDEDATDLAEAQLQVATESEWAPVSPTEPVDVTDVETVADLRELVSDLFDEDDPFDSKLIAIPFAKLRAKMKEEGWKFVGGSVVELEGHHTDTEIFAMLEEPATASAPQVAAAPKTKKAR